MTRRKAIQNGVLMAFGMALGKMDTLKASSGQLTVPLDQWGSLVFTYRGKTVTVSVAEVFRAMTEIAAHEPNNT